MKKLESKGKIEVGMFHHYEFYVYTTDDLKGLIKREFAIDLDTRTACTVSEDASFSMAFDIKSLTDYGLELIVHECNHVTTDFMEACNIKDDEFSSYCSAFLYKETVKLLDKWKVPYVVV